MRRLGPLLIVAVALGGCGFDATGVSPVVIDTPVRWGGEPKVPSRTVQGEGEVDLRWWRSFHDPELSSLVDRVAAQNLDLRTATERVIQSAAQRGVTAAQGLPHVDGSSTDMYNRASPNGILKLVQGAPGAPLEFPLYNEGLTSSWELDLFGRVRRAVEAADAEVLASAEARNGVALAALAEVAQDYLQLRGAQTRTAIARANVAVAARNVALVEDRLGNGYATTLELAQARAQLATVTGTLPPLLTQEAQLINAIGLLLGETPRALEGELKPPRLVPRVPRTVPVGLPGTLVRRRPDVREAEAHLHAATAQTGVAVANFYPSVTLTGALNLQAIRFGDLAKLSSTAWNVGPSVTVPIFEGGRLKGQLELRESQQREAAVQFQKTVLQAWQQVDDALTAYAQAQRRRADLARAVGQNEAALAASRQRYREGLVDFLNVNQAEVQLLSSQTDFADAETQIATDLVQLYRALGGGWDVVDGPGAFDHPAPVGPPGAIPTLIDEAIR
ncbi:efflux transporter outer membrane subunit [Lichenibacterium dinghuense]|uniref:efflux transporter outer membrane subunit n=1 Tax=Lichenibacterium dinghuense TaxID=2895977 RepID=UPI001EFF792C|nr:efflux transporter outer membrane subunit [Lichenibacterium sp. 6Y81]